MYNNSYKDTEIDYSVTYIDCSYVSFMQNIKISMATACINSKSMGFCVDNMAGLTKHKQINIKFPLCFGTTSCRRMGQPRNNIVLTLALDGG
jgi:hypothetical protein